MTKPLIECIPNFSEARRPEVIGAIIEAIQSVDGVRVLDQHSDLDHNRTVITMVGSPSSIEEAAFQSIKTARNASTLSSIKEHTRALGRQMSCHLSPSLG